MNFYYYLTILTLKKFQKASFSNNMIVSKAAVTPGNKKFNQILTTLCQMALQATSSRNGKYINLFI